jgi:hypothetical protein
MTTTSDHQTELDRLDVALDELKATFGTKRDYIDAGQLIAALSEIDPNTPILTVITDGVHVQFLHLSKLFHNEASGEAALQFGGTDDDYSGKLAEARIPYDLFTPAGAKDLLIEHGMWMDPAARIQAASDALLHEVYAERTEQGLEA